MLIRTSDIQLTPGQQCLIAMAAGCRVRSVSAKDGILRLETVNPVGFVEIDGNLTVVERGTA